MKLTKKFWINQLGERWSMILKDTLRSEYMEKLMNFLKMEYTLNKIRPSKEDVFLPFKLCPWESLKVVIIGSDPSTVSQSSGLLMGTNSSINYPSPKLFAIRKYIETDYEFKIDFDFSLKSWASQGVLLLNSSLTARKDFPNSHLRPWNKFISNVITEICNYNPGTIFLFLGKEGLQFKDLITNTNDILFLDVSNNNEEFNKDLHSDVFKKIDSLLKLKYGTGINWQHIN